ncbi:hypothetical protein AA0121_g8794 [Alternaria tenuissima]|nr:hypothetical protein AA0121_g8794 [Alternaria tenuissima]
MQDTHSAGMDFDFDKHIKEMEAQNYEEDVKDHAEYDFVGNDSHEDLLASSEADQAATAQLAHPNASPRRLHEPQNLQNLFVVTREIDNMGDVGSEVRLHFYKEMIHWNAGRRGTVWYSKAPAVSGAIPMTHITQYFHEQSGQLDKYGDDWEESFRSRIEEADDITATDMMQHKDDKLEGFVDYDIRDMGKGLLKHPKEKPLPGPGQLLVLLLGNMASSFPNLMTPTSGQLTGTMGSMYLTTPPSTYPRSPVTPGRIGPPSTQKRGVTSATVTPPPLASLHRALQPKSATSPFRRFNCLALFLKMRSPLVAS